ncbi:MAG: PhzF family phenazine biosynthesis protein [Chloroflexota bacterium]|nr:PhzF family phenazine biosynthesis protein [Chloroflexota bacterium]
MTHSYAIRHVDAFTPTPLEGNPAAVVDGTGLDTETMQRIALNQRLSETVFLLAPESAGNHARIRIFTPHTELPFAGHPTIAAAHILISEGRVQLADGEPLLIETGAGVIPVDVVAEGLVIGPDKISRSGRLYTMTQAAPQFRDAHASLDEMATCVGLGAGDVIYAEEVSTGIYWPVAQLASLEAMLRVQPDFAALMKWPFGVAVFCIGAQAQDADIHVRAFAPAAGVFEDPVTGSANGCIGAFIAKHGLLPARDGEIRYVAEQGIEMGQPGRVYVRVTGGPDAPRVHVGGHAVTVLRGELSLA